MAEIQQQSDNSIGAMIVAIIAIILVLFFGWYILKSRQEPQQQPQPAPQTQTQPSGTIQNKIEIPSIPPSGQPNNPTPPASSNPPAQNPY